ncbi:signal transducer and activator of transcription 2 [Bufo bufo]|uniref:signal transducer and activator of transcription 2 n=1 Tax=Bufo bufo TaxID=8384 RepID=UPI001ABE8DAB|nr:signal transducer and activator of transcription 2 [Bufo bufo]XP_040281542.1 signal transducer and activator of transcription 2 [Bufo bufo]
MSQWEAILKLPDVFQEEVHNVYSQEILPVEVRQYLAHWLESQDWKLAARDWSLATILCQNLFEHLDIHYSRFTDAREVVQANSMRNFKLKVQSQYQENPMHLAELIRELLVKEKQIILDSQESQSQNGQQAQLPMKTGQQSKIEQRVNEVKEHVMLLDQEVKFLEEQQEIFDFRYKTYKIQLASRPTDPDLKKKLTELQAQVNDLDRKRREILDQVKQLLGLCETLLDFLKEELSNWLQRQRLFCIGAATNTCLKKLETWVTKTVEVFFQLKRILCNLGELPKQVSYEGDPLKIDPPKLLERLLEMLRCLLQRSFVISKQPIMAYPCKRPLVLKTSTQFSVGGRFLVNFQELRHNMKVSHTIDKYPPDIKGYRRFNLLGTQDKALEYTKEEELAVEYKHLTLREQKAGGGGKGSKGANDGLLSVMEELHIITLKTQFNYEGVKLDIEASTLPFVVISNLTQFVRAWASVLWFNLISPDPKDVAFFSNPPAAPWILVADVLSWQFSFCTKRGLNANQLQMLGKKLCGSVPNEDSIVTWNKFSKENMHGVSFTFWEWFDAVLALVVARLLDIWNDSHVMGFVSRITEEDLLKTKQQGTFLLRFSESMRDGGITCSWVDHQPDGTYLIQSVEPFTKKELCHIPLTEIIRNYQLLTEENIPENPLKYLYPNIPKDEAFGKYYEERTEVNLEYQRYMTRRLIMVSERNVDDSHSSIASGTPQYFSDTSQSEHEMCLQDPAEYLQDVAVPDNLNQMTMDEVFINPGSDPMFSVLT